ncbi:MAG TPA: 2Fe-2S iron-sulfur cluster-binding protein [Solirubrobacteraceae bacterium]|nr:2Fe-2S iron-sulfur cluster-binding protein [Solirubrobacteraceae bacterium]
MTRLPERPEELIERRQTVRFTFDGRPAEGYAGDTIASALYAEGRRVFSRSFKYHRPRGLMCCAGQCPNCLVAVDGTPGARACTEPLREGMRVEHLNARPSLDFDVMRATDLVGGPFTPPGFYYKTFIRPRRLWPLYEKILRHAAGLGILRREQPDREWRTDYRRRHADILVVGGGVAGLSAALSAAALGADVVLVDEGPRLGGRGLLDTPRAELDELIERVRQAGVEILDRASALGYFDGIVPVWRGDTLHQVRAARHVLATGTVEQPLVFAGNDLPGVMLSDGARRLAALYSVSPGRRAVVATTGDRGHEAALALHEAGVQVLAVADTRPEPGPAAERCRGLGIEVLAGRTVVEAQGHRGVERVLVAPVGEVEFATERNFACDLLVISGGAAPAASLALQAGASAAYDQGCGQFRLSSLPESMHAAGELAGEPATAVSGTLAGYAAAHALGLGDADSRARALALGEQMRGGAAQESPAAAAPAVSGRERGKCFACLCEDVTAKDIAFAIAEGFDSIELCKRYTTVTMGPCQGRMCQVASVRLMAEQTGQSLGQVGTTTARPPWVSVPMGILAGRPFQPAKRSSIHQRHRQLGARINWAGDWRRAYDYGDPQAEALAVHRTAGLIDVSTLGKLLVQGPEAGPFLDRLYPNRFSNLAPGRIRYGVISSDAGRIVDDGTICRLDDETFYVTTTSSGAGAMEEWFSWWLADWRMQVHLTDLTQGLAAVNLAGPQARAIMSAVTDLDVSAEAFKYLDARRAPIAGVPCLILRIGFVGEVGYEIHCPAAYGQHLWDALLEAGQPHGIRPFGLEPQRILRLQKLHILVGQDTDSESTPFGAAMPWIVKLDKPEDFIGRWALEHYAEHPAGVSLVGFTTANGDVPTEGAVVLDAEGRAAGQVTSARRSPVLEQTIGMAWVPDALARDGATITISDQNRRFTAAVQKRPFYDPDGEVLRS